MTSKTVERRVTLQMVSFFTEKDQNSNVNVDKDTLHKMRIALYTVIGKNFNYNHAAKEKLKSYAKDTLERLEEEPMDQGRQSALESVLRDFFKIDPQFQKLLSDMANDIEQVGQPDYHVFFSCRHVDRCKKFHKNSDKMQDKCIKNRSKSPCYYKNTILTRLEEKYLFCWDMVPDENREFLESLNQIYGIDWINEAKIEKIDAGRTIKVYTEKNSLSLRLNEEKNEVKLEIDDGRIDNFIVRIENSSLKLFQKNNIEFVGRNFASLDHAFEEMNRRNEKNCLFILNSHRPINELTYFQLGYALAKGIKILRLSDKYLFCWDEISENDDGIFKEFLIHDYGINWINEAKIEKINGGSTIKVYTEKNFLSLKLNDEKNEVELEIDDGRIDKFIAKTENDKIGIYNDRCDDEFLPEDISSSSIICETQNIYDFINKINQVFEKREPVKIAIYQKNFRDRPIGSWCVEYNNGNMYCMI